MGTAASVGGTTSVNKYGGAASAGGAASVDGAANLVVLQV